MELWDCISISTRINKDRRSSTTTHKLNLPQVCVITNNNKSKTSW